MINSNGEIIITSIKLKDGRKVSENIFVEASSKTKEAIDSVRRILSILVIYV